ncbi:MAG TPA: OmpH family outer membrane protein [Firmicutes bacterium]|nr:OmpH family outer membrane protein [Bacillota bacterium]
MFQRLPFKFPAVLALVLLVVAAAAGVAGWSLARADRVSTVGYVDTGRVANEFPDMKAMRQQLEKDTKAMQQEYDRKAASLSQEQKVKLFQEYQAKLDQKKEAMVSAALAKVMQVTGEVAKKQGLTVVLEKQTVLYGGTDITDSVIRAGGGRGK